MADIVTLTINPSIDVSTSVEQMVPIHKLRCTSARRDPGGGGINVARVVKRFGGDVTAMYAMGGTLGQLLRHLLDQEGIPCLPIPISEETREDFTVLEEMSGRQYRFVLPGPRLSEREWHAYLDTFASHAFHEHGTRFVVASGSLPPGVPSDFYGRIARATKQAGAKFIVDTSGPPLKAALEAGVFIVKPSLRELKELMAAPLESERDRIAACRSLIESGRAEMVALTLGDQGALLVARDQALRAQAVPIKPVSVVGAGDSFLGAMIWSSLFWSFHRRCISIWNGRRIGGIAHAGYGVVPTRGRRMFFRHRQGAIDLSLGILRRRPQRGFRMSSSPAFQQRCSSHQGRKRTNDDVGRDFCRHHWNRPLASNRIRTRTSRRRRPTSGQCRPQYRPPPRVPSVRARLPATVPSIAQNIAVAVLRVHGSSPNIRGSVICGAVNGAAGTAASSQRTL